MNMEEIKNYISELESMFELSELEEHSRNILKVGNYIKQLQQENSRLKEELEELKHKHYLIQGGRGNGKTYLLHLQQENQELKKQIEEINKFKFSYKNDQTKIPPIIRKQKDVETIKNLENQQKEFIEWLTNEANINSYDISDYIYGNIINAILSKYNEIIGGKDDKK